jgi:hypothetical protein
LEGEEDGPDSNQGADQVAEGAQTGADVAGGPVADIGLQLAPAQEQLTPDEEAAVFVKRMEAERASDFRYGEEPEIQGFTVEQSPTSLGGGLVDAPEGPRPAAPPPPKSREERREEPRREQPRWEEPRREEPRREAPTRTETKAPKRRKGTGAGRKYVPLVIVAAILIVGGVYFGPELLAPGREAGDAVGEDSPTVAPPPAPLIPDSEGALRERAQERFLTTTRALLRDLPRIPDVWLQGAYLAAPSDYPQVRDVWNQYLTTIRQVRAGDDERYRSGYLRALDDARVEGSERTLRLAGAMAAFQGAAAPRAARYDRAEALVTAALRGHDALVAVEGTIAYEPASRSPVSGDPVVQAVGRNPDAQALLNQVLDMILTELNGAGGPGRASNVGEWIWDGILDAVTR